MSETGYRISTGADLNTVFEAYNGFTTTATGYQIASGADLNTVFDPYVSGAQAAETGFKLASGADLSTVFSKGSMFNNLNASFPGLNGIVNTIHALSPTQVYIGGSFTGTKTTPSVTLNNITMWNGTTFTQFNSQGTIGLSGIVQAIHALSPTQVYIGASLGRPYNNITMWNGTSFTVFDMRTSNNGFGLDGPVHSIYALSATQVYIGGRFNGSNTGDGGQQIRLNNIGMWNGSRFSGLVPTGASLINSGFGLDSNQTVYYVYSIFAVDAANVYIVGDFTRSVHSSTALNYITKWNGSTFLPLSSGSPVPVRSLYVYNNSNVYYAYNFDFTTFLRKWNGSTHVTLGQLTNSAMANYPTLCGIDQTHIYIGGTFTRYGSDTSYRNVAMWDGTKFVKLNGFGPNNSGTPYIVVMSAANRKTIYMGGSFTSINSVTMNNITMYGVL
jgi:hypothetical protein